MKLLKLIFCLFLVSPSLGQELPTILTPSPNVAALTRFGDVPVSSYTGIPSISVPLFEINSAGLRLPITVDYHAGGVHMADDAGIVGLNWALNAGGAISRSVRSRDDLTSYESIIIPEMTLLPQNNVVLMGPPIDGWENKIEEAPGVGDDVLEFGTIFDNASGFEWSADFFSFNIMGNAGKFILDRKGEIVFEKQTDILLTYENNGFKLVDTNGVAYYFNTIETGDAGQMSGVPTSWQITKIVSPLGEEVDFYYSALTQYGVPQYNDVLIAGIESCGESGWFPTTVANTHYTQVLDSIVYDGGRVIFGYDSERLDYSSGQGRKLSSCKVFEGPDNDLTKQYNFGYSYFNEDKDYTYKRLKLDYVQEVAGGSSLPPYQFKYKDPPIGGSSSLTSKNTLSIDHWGFFNNQANSRLYKSYSGDIQKYSGTGSYINTNYHKIDGANRDVDPNYSDVFSLEEITYPTGGRTFFEMESNDFDYDNSYPGNLSGSEYEYVTKSYYETIDQSGLSSGTIDLSKMQNGRVSINVTFLCQSSSNCSFNGEEVYVDIFGEHILASEQDCFSGQCTFSKEYSGKNQTTYPYTVYVGNQVSNLSLVRISYTIDELKTDNYVNNQHYFFGGGLRVKSITNFDESDNQVSRNEYIYHYQEDRDNDGVEETYSYGVRLSPPQYSSYQFTTVSTQQSDGGGSHPGTAPCPQFVLYGSSTTGISSSASGKSIGYSIVEEIQVNVEGEPNGKTINKYHNELDFVADYIYPGHDFPGLSPVLGGINVRKPGLTNQGDNRNGDLLKTEVYSFNPSDQQYSLVQATENFYRTATLEQYYNLDFHEVNYVDYLTDPKRYYVTFYYPIHQNRVNYLDSTSTTTFQNGLSLRQTTDFKYESPYHYQKTKEQSYLGQGQHKTVTYSYPTEAIINQDFYAFDAQNKLKAAHMISTVLESEERIEIDGQVTSSKVVRNNFRVGDALVPQLSDVEVSIDDNPLEERVEYKKYDSEGKLLTVAKSTDHDITYVWGYDNQLPIAEVINAHTDEVFYSSFEDDGKVGLSATGDKYLNAGNYSIPAEKVPTGTNLVVSFWFYNGTWNYSPPVPYAGGVISKTGATRIDEIRVYPVDALMTTYTHRIGAGPSCITDTNGLRLFYEYDDFNRLAKALDNDRNVVEQYTYDYLDQLSIDQSALSFTENGGIKSLEITTNRNWSIDIPSADTWYSISETSGVGGKVFTVSADPNNTESVRSSTLTISTDKGTTVPVTITQSAIMLNVPGSLTINQSGSPISFDITSNTSWSITESASWINSSQITPASGFGNRNVTVDVGVNNSANVLTGSLQVTTAGGLTKNIPISQDALASYLNVSPTSITLDNAQDLESVTVNANVSWSTNINYVSGFGWLRVLLTGGGFNLTVNRVPPASGTFEAMVEVTGGGITRTVWVTFNNDGGLGGL